MYIHVYIVFIWYANYITTMIGLAPAGVALRGLALTVSF